MNLLYKCNGNGGDGGGGGGTGGGGGSGGGAGGGKYKISFLTRVLILFCFFLLCFSNTPEVGDTRECQSIVLLKGLGKRQTFTSHTNHNTMPNGKKPRTHPFLKFRLRVSNLMTPSFFSRTSYDCMEFEIVDDADPTSSKITAFTPSFTENCKDLNKRCDYWARIGECNRNSGYMRIFCKKSCHLCYAQGI